MAALLAHRHVRHPGVLDQDLVQVVLVGERADRGGVPHEHLRGVAGRPTVPDVVDHRPADVLEQRQLDPLAGLGLHHAEPVARPVDVGEPQPFDVDAAQPERGDQQDDRVVPFPARVAPVDRGEDPGDLAGSPHRRDPGLPARAHRRDRVQDGRLDEAVGGREPQERPHRAHLLLDSLDLVSRQGRDERVEDPGAEAGQPAPGTHEREELPGECRVGPHRRGGLPRGPQRRREPGKHPGVGRGQLVDGPRVAAQHGPVHRVGVEHRRDPEQVDVVLLERARALLHEETARLVDPGHRHVQGELLDAASGEVPLQAAPATPVPDHRRVLVAQTL